MNADERMEEMRTEVKQMWARNDQLPAKIDITKSHIARVYDFILGGKDNYEVDRKAAGVLLSRHPSLRAMAWANREFLQRGVTYLAQEAGIDQFIDVGSGLPTQRNVHQVAQEINPDAKVLYVDIDPIVLAHGRALLAENGNTKVIQADIAHPSEILDLDETQELIDLSRPWAFIGCLLLHHLKDEQDPVGVMRQIKDRMVPGCHVLLSNFLRDDDDEAEKLERDMLEQVGTAHARDWPTNMAYFEGLELVDPGVVYIHEWRPHDLATQPRALDKIFVGGIGRKTDPET